MYETRAMARNLDEVKSKFKLILYTKNTNIRRINVNSIEITKTKEFFGEKTKKANIISQALKQFNAQFQSYLTNYRLI